jgi:3-hydroxyisobutyrate dehydrogenase-like beta-hydroxyacid dehydrogenase
MSGLRIGFAGVGFMGKGMVHNILKRIVSQPPSAPRPQFANKVVVFDKNHENIFDILRHDQRFESCVEIASDPADLGKRCDVVSLSLPSESIAQQLLFSETSGICGGYRTRSRDQKSTDTSPLVLIDHGTMSRKFVLDCHKRAKEEFGAVYLDGKNYRLLLQYMPT